MTWLDRGVTDDDLPQPGGVPLRDPFPGAPFGEAFRRFWRKYTMFRGRASRAEYWWWWLTSWAVSLVLLLVPQIFQPNAPVGESPVGSYLLVLWFLVVLVGNLSLGARRLHDINASAYWLIALIVPVLGEILIWVMALLPSNPKGARFDA
jgi:uncharacterized membrane protein YhaH (DUF805 family)